MRIKRSEIVIMVAIKAITVLLFTLLINSKLMVLIATEAIKVSIIGLALSSVIKRIVIKITIKFSNKEKKDRTPFLPPIVIIKIAKIIVNKKITDRKSTRLNSSHVAISY